MDIIPAIDLIEGKCVRLTEGDYSQKKEYSQDPLAMAKFFEDKGVKRLHIVDLEGAKQKKIVHLFVLEKIAQNTNLIIDYGGGIQTTQQVKDILNAGASMVSVGSLAVKNEALFLSFLEEFGAEKILLASDVKNEKILTNAWQEGTEKSVFDFLENFQKKGLKQFFCTDVSKDGKLEGTNLRLYQKLRSHFPTLELIASGGVTEVSELEKLEVMKIDGVIIGKAIYEGRISFQELEKFL